MAGKTMDPRRVRCSFCGKSQSQVNRLIAGPEGIYICDECVEICAGIIGDDEAAAGTVKIRNMENGEEMTVPADDAVRVIKGQG